MIRNSKTTNRTFVYPSVRDIATKVESKLKASKPDVAEQRNMPTNYTNKLLDNVLTLPEYSKYTKTDFYNLMDSISKVETNNSNVKQHGGGPARGFYQIENNTLPTAINRVNNYQKELGFDLGFDFNSINDKNIMNQSKDIQQVLALVNMLKKSEGKLNPKDPMNTWLNYHWSGSEKDKEARIQHWNETISKMQNN